MSANAVTDFKNRYAGGTAVDDHLSEWAVKRMLAAYEATYNAIYRQLGEARKSLDYATFAKQSALLKQIAQELDDFNGSASGYLNEATKQVVEYAATNAIKDMDTMGLGVTAVESWHAKFGKQYVEDMFKDNYSHIAAQTNKMLTDVKSQLRADSAQVFQRASVEGLSSKQAYYALRSQIADHIPDFKFIDRAGRVWETDTYFEMLTRTVIANASQESYINQLTSMGQDLVKVSRHQVPEGTPASAIPGLIAASKKARSGGGKKGKGKGKGRYVDACAFWEGVVLSLTGSTPKYPTLAQARSSGQIFHPRCRHRLLAYNPTMDDVFKAYGEQPTNSKVE